MSFQKSRTPPRFFYLSPIHAIALNKSVFTVDNRKGVSVVWGDIGTGKSTLARIMHERFLNKGYISVLLNPSCHLLAFHGILRFNEDEISTTLGKEEPHGRKNYSDILLV